jgi:hypothetical protein
MKDRICPICGNLCYGRRYCKDCQKIGKYGKPSIRPSANRGYKKWYDKKYNHEGVDI